MLVATFSLYCLSCWLHASLFCVCLVEIATLTRENGKTKIKVLKQKDVEELIKKHEAEEAKAEKDKKEKEQKEKEKWGTYTSYFLKSKKRVWFYSIPLGPVCMFNFFL